MELKQAGIDQDTFSMNLEVNRIASFKDWPFDSEDCMCSSKRLAEAGFYHIPSDKEPDLVRCFVCLKELEGWEPEDDPWQEHKKHAPKCSLVKLNKREIDWKIEDVIRLEVKRQEAIMKKYCDLAIEKFQSDAEIARENLEQIMN